MARNYFESRKYQVSFRVYGHCYPQTLTFAFARIAAVVAMRVEDYYPKGKRWWVRLHEKGGKRHEIGASQSTPISRRRTSATAARAPSSAPPPAAPAR
jgi:hypothetical protein